MNISGTGGGTVFSGYQAGEAPIETRAALLKKVQDQMKARGAALVEVIEALGGEPVREARLNVYA